MYGQTGSSYTPDAATGLADFARLVECATGPAGYLELDCTCFDYNGDWHVDLRDAARFQQSFAGE